MIFAVVVSTNQSDDEKFANALTGVACRRKVHVVGMSDVDAFALALNDENVAEIKEADAHTMLKFTYCEVVGAEGVPYTFDQLLTVAKRRVKTLQDKNPSPLARIAA